MNRQERDENNHILYEQLRAGDPDARDKLIVTNMELCEQLAKKFVEQTEAAAPLLKDLISEGHVALIEFVDELASNDLVQDVGKWLSKAVMRRFSEYECDQQIGPSKRRQNQRRSEYSEAYLQLENEYIEGLIDEQEYMQSVRNLDEEHEYTTGVEELTDLNDSGYTDPGFALVDLQDAIEAACQDEVDHQIVALRVDGLTDDEIGEQLSVSGETVRLRRRAIEARFNGEDEPKACTPASRTIDVREPDHNFTHAV